MQIPKNVSFALEQLEQHGHEAYVVGGCVRDTLLGIPPHDWDICTSAQPSQVIDTFSEHRVINTGLAHGTVTVLIDGQPLEITTFRTESGYDDHRHPQHVEFVSTIEEDLSRRDFTVNAVAYHPKRGFVDPYGGRKDAQNALLRCVGDATTRMEEDALRILRALRFASVYDLHIVSDTREALLHCSPTLTSVSGERIQSELKRILSGKAIGRVLRDLYPVLFSIIPELKAADGVEQHSPYHCYDVLQHILKTVEYAHPDTVVRLAALLHDIGKPSCFTWGEDGNGHFYGHARVGVDMASDILRRLRFDKKTVDEVCILIKYHDTPIEQSDAAVKRWLNRLGDELFNKLLLLKRADCMAHDQAHVKKRFDELDDIKQRMDRLLNEKACFSLRDLAINGDDLQQLGIPKGRAIGVALDCLLNDVIEQRLNNDKSILLEAARKRLDYFVKSR
ncbi:MAG: HD domain-containing protein [Clostridia bacterium]|nr:HD domain-containing protein [Clostridia bacterium]